MDTDKHLVKAKEGEIIEGGGVKGVGVKSFCNNVNINIF